MVSIARDEDIPFMWTIKLHCGHLFRIKSTPDLADPMICSEDGELCFIDLAERIPS